MKKILVTGSSGYIGQHLVKLLKKEGYEVFGTDKEKRTNDYLLPKEFQLHDINNNWSDWYNSLADWPEKFDAVVHLAAKVRVNESMEYPYEYYDTNFNGTLNVLNAFEYDNFIFASTGAAETPISPYALSKRCAEDIVREYCTRSKLDYTMFRFYNVIGSDGVPPTNPDGLMFNLIKAKTTGEINIFGNDYNTIDGTPVRDYVHVMDICRAIQRAIEKPANGLENLGTGTGYTVKEIADTFLKVNDINAKINYLPRRSGDAERTVLDKPSSYMINSYSLEQLVKI
jgi:UDP-glucose 4-epimerase